jgi:hypothetical protein
MWLIHAEMWGRVHKDFMESFPFEKVGWYPKLKLTAEVKLGPSLGDLKKLKLKWERRMKW